MDEVIVLDVKGDYAHFKKIFTTTSPLTYGIPPKTAITGLLAAILGYERDSYYEAMGKNRCRTALKILNPIKKTRVNLNLLKTKDKTENLIHYNKDYPENVERIQVPLEAVKNPKYRLFISLEEKQQHQKLKRYLTDHKSIFTPYLGLSEFIAQFEYIGTKESVEKTSAEKKISSVIPESYIPNIRVEEDLRYERERVPGHMKINPDGERTPDDFIDLVYEKNGNSLLLEDITYQEVEDDRVLFF